MTLTWRRWAVHENLFFCLRNLHQESGDDALQEAVYIISTALGILFSEMQCHCRVKGARDCPEPAARGFEDLPVAEIDSEHGRRARSDLCQETQVQGRFFPAVCEQLQTCIRGTRWQCSSQELPFPELAGAIIEL